MKRNFMVIDDSELDCFIAEKMIRHSVKCLAEVMIFTDAGKALSYISEQPVSGATTILLLDILMPVVSGFDFMDAFEQFPESIQKKYCIVALTSTMNKNDLNRIVGYKDVKYLLDKPITAEALMTLLQEVNGNGTAQLS